MSKILSRLNAIDEKVRSTPEESTISLEELNKKTGWNPSKKNIKTGKAYQRDVTDFLAFFN